jgi:membrane protease YdiL (CAAX protease family)
MTTSPTTRPLPSTRGSAPRDGDIKPLLAFTAVAIPVGWVLLSVPVALGLPQEPFVLAALLLGLVTPAVLLTARTTGRVGVRALLRDAVRLPRPTWWLAPALLGIPVLSWLTGAALGAARPFSGGLVADVAIQLLASALIINIWEEMAWTGFVQRRAMARWGTVTGSVVTAAFFAGLHLPLAFAGAASAGDVLVGVAQLVGTGIGLRFLVAGIDRWSGGSLLTVGLLHASFNATGSLLAPGSDPVRLALTVVAGLLALAVLQLRSRRAGRRLPVRPS